MIDLVYIPKDRINAVWGLALPLIVEGVKNEDNHYTVGGLKKILDDEFWQLWMAWNGKDVLCILMTEVYIDMTGTKVGSLRFISGKNRKDWLCLIDELELQMEKIGVRRLEMLTRKGWVKEFPDYKISRIFLTKDLTDGRRQNSNDHHGHDPTATSVRASATAS